MTGAASAADLEPVAAYDWTGFYAGLHAGYHFGSSGGVNFDSVFGPLNPDYVTARETIAPQTLGDELDGFIGGAQLGYNFQIDSFVLGLETDISYLDLDEDDHVIAPVPPFANHDISSSQSIDWLGTTRLRLGYAFDRALVYLTGGLAYGDTEFSYRVVSESTGSGGDEDFKVGWTIGGGLDYAISEAIVLRGEYLYYDLGKSSSRDFYDFSATAGEEWNAKFRGNIIRGGVNFRF
jgi:outer membrane immunogenic protein